ncbi:MAG: tRNA glutamyl-Q(34) synthetase GluQRS, partial [Ramlibacter sp.]|nr:tRNA glutamyl-Q(34) synthetase GluQRS [Ramlibacter sp.]
MGATYIGRFAPSPTGPLHDGSLVAALASWLDARAHGGRWLVRIEDVDRPRCVPGAAEIILQQLAELALVPDAAPAWQSEREPLYRQALERLIGQAAAYPCACSRKDIEAALAAQGDLRPRHGELVYPGSCRHGLGGRAARAWRFRTDGCGIGRSGTDGCGTGRFGTGGSGGGAGLVRWHDRRLGPQQQDVEREVGDFVLKRADGLWAYQLAVVVDDA